MAIADKATDLDTEGFGLIQALAFILSSFYYKFISLCKYWVKPHVSSCNKKIYKINK